MSHEITLAGGAGEYMESATVVAENNTVRPAVTMVRSSASSRPAPSANSSR